MGNDRDAPQLKAEPPALDVTPNQPSPSVEEAQTEVPKLDSTLIGLHEIQKNDRPDGEIYASEADLTTHKRSGASGEGGVEEKLEPSHEPGLRALNNPELDAQSNQSGNQTDSFMTEEEVDSDDDDTISEQGTQDSGSKRRQVVSNPRSMRKALRERIAKAPKRLAQHAKYAKLVEDRLADVEERLNKMESQRPNKTEDDRNTESASSKSRTTSPEPKGKYTNILGINRLSFEHYKPKERSDLRLTPTLLDAQHHNGQKILPELPQRHIIEVVIPHSNASEASQSHLGVKVSGVIAAAKASPVDAAAAGLAVRSPQHTVPERIRINSSLLLETLKCITGIEFVRSSVHGVNYGRIHGQEYVLKTQVILSPFKILVTFEHEIREHLKEKLALLHAKRSVPASTAEANGELSPELIATMTNDSCPRGVSGSRKPSSDNLAAHGAEIEINIADESMEESERCVQELQVLVELLDNDLKPIFDLRRRIQEGDIRSIAFCDLWHLFRIGGEIRVNEGHSQVYRIVDIIGGRPALCSRAEAEDANLETGVEVNDPTTLTISCFCYGFNGKNLGPIQRIFEIQKYDESKPITSLPVYPVEFSGTDNGDLKREDFVRRGRKFVELTKNKSSIVHRRYNGLAMNLEEIREEVDSEVIIDTSMALLKNPSLEIKFGITKKLDRDIREIVEFLDPDGCKKQACHQNTAIHKDYQIDDERSASVLEAARSYRDMLESVNNMQPEDLLICPCMVYGYGLRGRKWMSLDVRLVEDIAIQESGFESLVLPKGHSETLLALVETHSKGAKPATGQKVVERQIDLVRGKGKGLIILLHGEPGVGKTSTAECVAEYTKRPLFQVTCGDIGSSAEVVERTLENHFQLAHKWGCVLLLDEADVFLMARSKQDLKRNAIVSVFLRVLEYYSGILFLTTNRVGTFDPAFRSRIHMSFFYPKLDLKTTLKIWTMNLDRTRKMWAANIEIDPQEREKILAFAEEHFKDSEKLKTTWNGRQIRNAFQTAIALADYEIHKVQKRFKLKEDPVPRLEAWQFEKVAEASKHFDEYLKATVGLEEDRARENAERRDDLGFDN